MRFPCGQNDLLGHIHMGAAVTYFILCVAYSNSPLLTTALPRWSIWDAPLPSTCLEFIYRPPAHDIPDLFPVLNLLVTTPVFRLHLVCGASSLLSRHVLGPPVDSASGEPKEKKGLDRAWRFPSESLSTGWCELRSFAAVHTIRRAGKGRLRAQSLGKDVFWLIFCTINYSGIQ